MFLIQVYLYWIDRCLLYIVFVFCILVGDFSVSVTPFSFSPESGVSGSLEEGSSTARSHISFPNKKKNIYEKKNTKKNQCDSNSWRLVEITSNTNRPLAVEMTVSVAHLPTLKHPFSWFKCARASLLLLLSVTDHHLTAGGFTARCREIQLKVYT